MKLNKRVVILFAAIIPATYAQAQSVYTSDNGKAWTQQKVSIQTAASKADAVNDYGGFTKRKVDGTGFFRVVNKSNNWWLVDPDGHPFIMKGVNSVEAKRVGRSDSKAWAKETYQLLRQTGFNTIGRWSEHDAFQKAGVPIPWCNTTSFMKDYATRRPAENGERRFPNETLPVFDKEWPRFCERYARKSVGQLKDDPWLIGHFSDNELPFRPDALQKHLALPKDDPGYQGAVEWMRKNRLTQSMIEKKKVRREAQKAFLEVIARRYFETVAAALKKADPNHLYLGSRLHGRCINEATISAAGACDVVSINYYHHWEPEIDRMKAWEKWSGRPFFISEFYAMTVANKEAEVNGVGFRVLTHEDAAAFYHTHVSMLLTDVPSCVGWHWFKYANNEPKEPKGIVGEDGVVHQPLLDGMEIINDQAYSLRGLR